MNNSEIAALFEELADIMELAGESYFKIRAYRNAAETIKSIRRPVKELSPAEFGQMPGIGKAILEKTNTAL